MSLKLLTLGNGFHFKSLSFKTCFVLFSQGYAQYQTGSAPPVQATPHSLQTQEYPQAVPYSNQAYPPPTQPIPQPDSGGGNINNAGFLLQQ